MRVMNRMVAVCALGVVLTGCANTNPSLLGDPGELRAERDGFVAASLVNSGDASAVGLATASIVARYYEVGNHSSPAFTVNTSYGMSNTGLLEKPGAMLPEPNGWRVLSLIRVPAGRYQLGSVTAQFPVWRKYTDIDVPNPPVVEVRAGEVTYLGSIQVQTASGTNIFGQVIPAASRLRLADDEGKDIPAMKRVDPRLAKFRITNAVSGRTIDSLGE